MIKIMNTLTGNKETFIPYDDQCITMYVCGITPYDYAHSGHGRCYITFDILLRLLKITYKKIIYCRNFTDIDDKLLQRAATELHNTFDYNIIAQKYIHAFTQDMQDLNCITPTYEPRVTEVIDEIIIFIEKLIKLKHAYIINNSVYFSITSFPNYGKLSKRNQNSILSGARVEINNEKKHPEDFVLWKAEKENTFWKSPWGYGRPGWHIECSVMANSFLHTNLDIHGGGMDLIFPHHENEIAQSESIHNAPFARYWIHNAFVRVNKEKMSKSLGNFFTLKDVFKKFDPMVFRFYILNHHYRSPLDFSFEELTIAEKTYRKIITAFDKITSFDTINHIEIEQSTIALKMLSFLKDDLNTVGLLGILFENLQVIINSNDGPLIKTILQQVLGITLQKIPESNIQLSHEVQLLLHERQIAREEKNWIRADEIRQQLQILGIICTDNKI